MHSANCRSREASQNVYELCCSIKVFRVLAEQKNFWKAILEARGDLMDPFNVESLTRFEDVLGPVDSNSVEAAKVYMAWGTAKEAFALEAATRALQAMLGPLTVVETGLVSCFSEARYACYFLSWTHVHRLCVACLFKDSLRLSRID